MAAGDGGVFALEDRTVAVISFTSLEYELLMLPVDCLRVLTAASNNSAQSGGALQSGSTANVTLSDSCFTNNTARVDGGAIESAASSYLNVTSCEFSYVALLKSS